ncbi:hypothetical protein ABT56_00760 [Photobacterium aquae]|uniref:tRNA(Met) cytidine acetyltransferase TmcA n=1 Tax=Photobacterium aquae TaxID=1195763 RepID=A0A0J1HDE2_9GAMM|nr:GNAT family N-acetyltransferase [Photobacterium aquae]KLV09641.1 hypothetical protein ABT56_00760 [Photobacterium aquae]
MHSLNTFCSNLIARAARHHIRLLVVAEGSSEWGSLVASQFSQYYSRVLVCGEPVLESATTVPFRQARSHLGQECDCLVYNGYCGFEAEALGALSGTIVGGGAMVLLLPEDLLTPDSLFERRMRSRLNEAEVIRLVEGKPLPDISAVFAGTGSGVLPFPGMNRPSLDYGAITESQLAAIEAIRRVVTGHRKRPLVLTADRGRGKSAAMGLAAASLLRERKIAIGVVAPSYQSSATLFRHVAEQLGLEFIQQRKLAIADSYLEFISPDNLLHHTPAFDLILVDEAAAIPAPLLSQILQHYNRLVFASTIHGYEGTGRGFAVKFRQQLDSKMPQWRGQEIDEPVRWAKGDPLEAWVFSTLLLDAELTPLAEEMMTPASLSYRTVDKETLATDEKLLSDVFGLLVNAHYQTSPSDLVALLDDPDLSLHIAQCDELVLGCVLVAAEGGFAEDLVADIQRGKRRPKGHLLVQSLAAHLGIGEAAVQTAGRIVRVAVHPHCQQQGIGSHLLRHVAEWGVGKFDYLGTSFGYVPELLSFWHRSGYQAIRLGLKRDAASGYPSLLCVLPLTEQSSAWLEDARLIHGSMMAANASEAFSAMDSYEWLPLYLDAIGGLSVTNFSLPAPRYYQLLGLYMDGGLGYELVLPALQTWLIDYLNTLVLPISEPDLLRDCALMIAKIIQRKPWPVIVDEFGFAGRKQAEQGLRDCVSRYCDLQCKSILY